MMLIDVSDKLLGVICSWRGGNDNASDALFQRWPQCVYDRFVKIVKGFGVASDSVKPNNRHGFGCFAEDLPQMGSSVF